MTIVSSGLDLADPDDFRVLNWTVSPAHVVADVKKSGDLPKLHGPVTFVLVPAAGPQPQLDQSQKDYLKDVWRALLTAAGATSVTFIDAARPRPGPRLRVRQRSSVPGPPPTPIEPSARGSGPGDMHGACQLLRLQHRHADRPRADHAEPVPMHHQGASPPTPPSRSTGGRSTRDRSTPADGPQSITPRTSRSAKKRVQAIADLLIDGLDVPRSDITRMTGHGNFDQPEPDPRSAANRVVVITYTTK